MLSKSQEYQKKYREDNRERINESRRRWDQANPERRREIANKSYANMRLRVFNLLGGAKCCKCGFDDIRALQIDHINGGGNDERRKYKSSPKSYFKRIFDSGGTGYQVLCANCNWIKRFENNELN